MTINYNLRKTTLKDSTKERIEKKINKLNKFFSESADTELKFTLNNNQVKAEITVKDKSIVYRAEDTQIDLAEAFDNAFDTLVRRIRKQKTKLEKRHQKGGFDFFAEFDATLESVVEEGQFEIARSKKFFLETTSVDEAILQMNLLDHTFFIFNNEETHKICVVYRRHDGKYGLLEPEVL